MSDEKPNIHEPKPKPLNAAAAALRAVLAAGPLAARVVVEEMQRRGFNPDATRRAREALNITPRKAGVKAGWTWALPVASGNPGEVCHLRASEESKDAYGNSAEVATSDTIILSSAELLATARDQLARARKLLCGLD